MATEEYSDLVKDELIRLSRIDSPSEKLQAFHGTAAKYEREYNSPGNAFFLLQHALVENPTDQQTIDQLERLADITEKWEILCESTTQLLHSSSLTEESQIFLFLKIGDWYVGKVERPDYAIACYQHVLEISEGNLQALRRIAGLYRLSSQWEDLVNALLIAKEYCEDKEEAKQCLIDAAGIMEKELGNTEEACNLYERALEIESDCPLAFDALERIYEVRSDWWQLIALLKRKNQVIEDSEIKLSLHLRTGNLLFTNADDPEGAAAEFLAAVEIEPGCLPAIESLESIYTKLETPKKTREMLERQVARIADGETLLPVLEKQAKLLEQGFSELDNAAMVWEQVLFSVPDHQQALDGLCRIYRRQKKWDVLAGTLENRIENTKKPADTIELRLQLAKVLEKELSDSAEALESYRQVLAIQPGSTAAHEGRLRIQTQNEDWPEAVESLKQLLGLAEETNQQVDLCYRIGTMVVDKTGDLDTASQYFRKALKLDNEHSPSLKALREGHMEMSEWEQAAQVIKTEMRLVNNETAEAKLSVVLGTVCRQLSNDEEAVRCFEYAHEKDPYNQQAMEALTNIYLADGRYADAEPLLETLVRLGKDRDDAEKFEIHLNLALASHALGKHPEMLTSAEVAYEIDSSPNRIKGILTNALILNEQWSRAFDVCTRIIGEHLKELSKSEEIDLLFRMGLCCANTKDSKKALVYLLKVLEQDPDHFNALELTVDLQEKTKEYDQIVKSRMKLARLQDVDERFDNYVRIGDICNSELNNTMAAIEVYLKAIIMKPDDRPLLHKLLPLYEETGQWQQLVGVIKRIAESETEPEKLARFYYSMGVICRDRLHAVDSALECFNAVLDVKPGDKKAFGAIVKMLAELKEWAKLELAYRMMIGRLQETGDKEQETDLWHQVGEIYRTRLGDFDAAAGAFETALTARPDNVKYRELLAGCYFNIPDRIGEAITEYRRLIHLEPENADFLRPLGSILASSGHIDGAWCVSAALVLSGKANSKERALYQQYLPANPPLVSQCLSKQQMQLLNHPYDNEGIAAIFNIVMPVILSQVVQPLKNYGLKKSQMKRKKNKGESLASIFSYAAGVWDLQYTPELYIKDGDMSRLSFAVTNPPASFCGEHYEEGRSYWQLLFMTAKHLAYFRPGRLVRWLGSSTSELQKILIAALKVGNRGLKTPKGHTDLLIHYANVLEDKLKKEQFEQLRAATKYCIETGVSSNIKKWVAGIEHTACRASMLLTGDLVGAAALIRDEGGDGGGPSVSSKVQDLMVYSISDEYLELRRSLGIGIS
ncbi:MAG: tetratricopeptide repeat protein [Deltaproteobacteria bacterium]|nr:tetratricopeptide repeat protein [Deltaproteobacteria bacterium]